MPRKPAASLPFIGDDLLASFNDERALAMLRLLATAGQRQQVIVFTHHRHVVDLATSLQEHQVDIVNL
jgi:uncharacterized protein YhaN